LNSFLSDEQFMYDDLGNQNLIVFLFNYNTRNIQVKYCTILSITAAFFVTLGPALSRFSVKRFWIPSTPCTRYADWSRCFQITQSFFYDVDATSAKKRRSVKLNLENVRSLLRRRENNMRYSATQLSALATVSYSLKGTVVVIW
jgi:hypothetical protein